MDSPDSRTAMREHLLDLGGLRHHVVERGAGPTVLLLHGYLDHARVFDRLAARLEGFRLLAPDLRGHGDTSAVGAGGHYYFPDYIADVHALITALADPPVAVVGHSMGGGVACYLAGAFPELVSHLVLIEGIGPPGSRFADAPLQLRGFVEDLARAAARPRKRFPSLEAAADRVRQRNPRIGPEDALALVRAGTRPDGDGVVWKFDPLHQTRSAIQFQEEQLLPFLARITAPVLVIEGEHGYLLDDATRARRLAALAHVETVRIPGAGHHVQLDAPDLLADHLRAFLAR